MMSPHYATLQPQRKCHMPTQTNIYNKATHKVATHLMAHPNTCWFALIMYALTTKEHQKTLSHYGSSHAHTTFHNANAQRDYIMTFYISQKHHSMPNNQSHMTYNIQLQHTTYSYILHNIDKFIYIDIVCMFTYDGSHKHFAHYLGESNWLWVIFLFFYLGGGEEKTWHFLLCHFLQLL